MADDAQLRVGRSRDRHDAVQDTQASVDPLAEPALGPVEKLSNGALVRKRRGRISIAGVPARHWLVASVYRNVFSISTSTAPSSTADKPISLSAQIALHRRFHEGVLALG